MYAVIQDGGREFKVADGDTVEIDLKASLSPGDEIVFERVLLVRKEDEVIVGKPTVEGAQVKGTVEGEVKGEKLVAYKYKRRKGYHRKKGHRQRYTRVRITGITA
ncbi:MAG: 50S ribosomal protein L21 [Planctomycetota bacterium]|jgi:large subunit ribosomal protein L21